MQFVTLNVYTLRKRVFKWFHAAVEELLRLFILVLFH